MRVPRAAQAPVHRIPHPPSPGGTVPVPRPEHAHTHQPPCRPHVASAHVSGPGWRLTGLYETIFGSISTCSSRRFQRDHPRVRQPPPWLSGFESGVRTRCARPFSPPPFALTAAQPSARAPPHVCCVQPKHPYASHAALTQPRRPHFPALSTRIPIGRPVALTWPVHTFQVRAGDSRSARRPSLARPLRARQRRFNGAMHEFGCCRVSSRAAVCCGV